MKKLPQINHWYKKRIWHNSIFLKTNSDKVTDIYNNEIPKVNSNYTCLAIISLDSALNKDGNCYPQVFLTFWMPRMYIFFATVLR